MYARISHVGGLPQAIEEGIASFRESTLPELKSVEGNRGAILLVDRETGNAMAITLWEDEESMQASEERANELRRSAADAMGSVSDTRVDRFEVAVFET